MAPWAFRLQLCLFRSYLRHRHGWSQQDLTDRLNQFGAQTDRSAVARVELEKRQLSLDDALLYALALDVAPVHLFVPTDSDEPLSLGANIERSPAGTRAWVRGERPIFPAQDPRIYFTEVPIAEFQAVGQEAVEAWRARVTEEETD